MWNGDLPEDVPFYNVIKPTDASSRAQTGNPDIGLDSVDDILADALEGIDDEDNRGNENSSDLHDVDILLEEILSSESTAANVGGSLDDPLANAAPSSEESEVTGERSLSRLLANVSPSSDSTLAPVQGLLVTAPGSSDSFIIPQIPSSGTEILIVMASGEVSSTNPTVCDSVVTKKRKIDKVDQCSDKESKKKKEALRAKMNRERKKREMENLKKEIEKLKAENAALQIKVYFYEKVAKLGGL